MKYITGVHALNLPCSLNTTGDWHMSWIQWDHPQMLDSEMSVYGDWGIELNHNIPEHEGGVPVANHIRACLDMLETGDFYHPRGMRDDFICWDAYTPLIFEKVMLLQELPYWDKIKHFMEKEYRGQWFRFMGGVTHREAGALAEQDHKQVVHQFLKQMNAISSSFILKGGTALVECYGLDRFSENIDLDASHAKLHGFMDDFCKSSGYSWRIDKDTLAVNRFVIAYGPDRKKQLTVEVSYRSKVIPPDTYTEADGIQVYTIDRMAQLKSAAYLSRDRIRDLYDLCYICSQYLADLKEATVNQIKDAFSYKGLDNFDYIVRNESDPFIDKERLADSYLKAFDRLGLFCTNEEKLEIRANGKSSNH